MKKLIALLLALMMVASMSLAMAKSPSSDDIVDVLPADDTDNKTPANDAADTTPAEEEVVPAVNNATVKEAQILFLQKTAMSDVAKALLTKLDEALKEEGSVAGVFPEELGIEKNAVVQEVFSATVNPDYEVKDGTDITEAMAITGDVSGAARVRVLIGIIPEDSETDEILWFEAKNVKIEEDGFTVTVTYPAEGISEKIVTKFITIVVLSIPAE